jgi:xylose dehydrogenase (NAD/NADP)
MTDAIRWGVLGVAGINAAMVPAIRACPGAELVGIASRDERRARAVAAAEHTRTYVGYDALLADPTVDAVYLPTPNAQHARWTLRAVAAGKHVLCEKPLAVTAAEARKMADAAAKADVILAEAFMYAHHPRFQLVRRLIADGAIGAVRSVHVTFTFDASDELGHSGFQGAPGSGAIYDVGCYAVHVARTLIGAEPEAVTAHAMSSTEHGDVDMSTSLLLEFPDGVGATAHLGMWNGDRDTVTVIGSRGWIEIPHAFLCSATDDADIVVGDGEGSRVIAVAPADHYALQVACFDAAVRGDGELLFPIEDAIRQALVLEAATRSWRERVWVPISAS